MEKLFDNAFNLSELQECPEELFKLIKFKMFELAQYDFVNKNIEIYLNHVDDVEVANRLTAYFCTNIKRLVIDFYRTDETHAQSLQFDNLTPISHECKISKISGDYILHVYKFKYDQHIFL